jgi:hypothetical protein
MATSTHGSLQLFHQPWRIAVLLAFQWAVENRIISPHALTIMYYKRWLIAGSIGFVKGNPQERDTRIMKVVLMFRSIWLRNSDCVLCLSVVSTVFLAMPLIHIRQVLGLNPRTGHRLSWSSVPPEFEVIFCLHHQAKILTVLLPLRHRARWW